MFTIGLAAGHTSHTDDDARRTEHTACWMARRIAAQILKDAGIGVCVPPIGVYTQPNDASLVQRVKFFNSQPLDAVAEIHLNRGAPKEAYSLALYWQRRTGPREFKTSIKGKRLAQALAASMKANLPWRSQGARGMEWAGRGGLYFLSKCQAPAVIVEAGFMDSQDNCWQWLNSPAGQVQHGMAIAQGIINYARVAS